MTRTTVYLRKSNKKDKKYMVWVDGKTIHFGAKGYSDYTKHKEKSRMKRYSERHSRSNKKGAKKEKWTKSGIKTAGFWAKWLLWNKPSIGASKRDISSRFGVTFKSGWPKKGSGARKTSKGKRKSSKGKKKSVRKSRKGTRKSRKGTRKSRKGKTRKSKKHNLLHVTNYVTYRKRLSLTY